MNIIDAFFLRFFCKDLNEIRTRDGDVQIKFPGRFKVRRSRNIIQVFDPHDECFLIQFSVLENKSNKNFDIKLELKNELLENPNAEIQNTGKYDCICSATKSEDGKEIIYCWKVGYLSIVIITSLMIFNLTERKDIDKRIQLAGEFLKGININTNI